MFSHSGVQQIAGIKNNNQVKSGALENCRVNNKIFYMRQKSQIFVNGCGAESRVIFINGSQVLHHGAGARQSVAVRIFVRNDKDIFSFQYLIVNLFGNNRHKRQSSQYIPLGGECQE